MVAAIEADTDRLALGPWRALGDAGCDRLAALLTPAAARRRRRRGDWPASNPIGVPDPDPHAWPRAAQVTRARSAG